MHFGMFFHVLRPHAKAHCFLSSLNVFERINEMEELDPEPYCIPIVKVVPGFKLTSRTLFFVLLQLASSAKLLKKRYVCLPKKKVQYLRPAEA